MTKKTSWDNEAARQQEVQRLIKADDPIARTDERRRIMEEQGKALSEALHKTELLEKDLAELRAKNLKDQARRELGAALDEVGIWPDGRDLAVKNFLGDVRNLRLDDDGKLVGSLGELESASPYELARAFLADSKNKLFLPIKEHTQHRTAPGQGGPRHEGARKPDGSPVTLQDLSTHEAFERAEEEGETMVVSTKPSVKVKPRKLDPATLAKMRSGELSAHDAFELAAMEEG